MKDINILALFGISIESLEKYEQVDNDDESVTFLVRQIKSDEVCSACRSSDIVVKDYRIKRYEYNSQTGLKIIILFEHRRYRCKICNKTFFEENPFINNSNYKISSNKIVEVINYLRDSIPVTLVSKYTSISVSSINHILDDYIKVKRRSLPEILSIDEFASFNSDISSKYACVLLDYKQRIIVDVLPSRRKEWLNQYLEKLSPEEIKKVKYLVMDMYQPYADAFRKYNPDITIIIDPFHYIRYVTDAIEKVRRRVMRQYLSDSVEYKLLKRFRRLLLTKYEPDTYRKIRHVKALNTKLYDNEILPKVLAVDKDIENAYFLGHEFLSNVGKIKLDKFKDFLSNTIQRFLKSEIKEFVEVANTYDNWRQEIINSKLQIDDGETVSNAKIEGMNCKIKQLKRACYGLRNFEHLRKRVFLIFDKNPTKKQ